MSGTQVLYQADIKEISINLQSSSLSSTRMRTDRGRTKEPSSSMDTLPSDDHLSMEQEILDSSASIVENSKLDSDDFTTQYDLHRQIGTQSPIFIVEEEILPDEETSRASCSPLHSRQSECKSIHSEKDQLRMRAALNGHVIFSHHPKEFGEIFHVEWWYYLSMFDHTMIPFFKHSNDGDSSIVQIGNAIHCRDYQLRLVPYRQQQQQHQNHGCIGCEGDLSHFWSNYFLDNQHRIITQNPMHYHHQQQLYYNPKLNRETIHDSSLTVHGGGHENSMIQDLEETSLFEFDNTSQDDLLQFNHLDWNETKTFNEEPRINDNHDDDEYHCTDIGNVSSEKREFQDDLSHMEDSTNTIDTFSGSTKGQDEDYNSKSPLEQSHNEEDEITLDQFIESSSYHINEQFKIISREFSRIFF